MTNGEKWITMGSLPRMIPENMHKLDGSVYFRKCFEAGADIERAKLCICALGLGVYTVNGKRAGDDVLCTPYTMYDKRVLYNTYDITGLLRQGENVIGVHVGNGFYNDNMTVWNDIMASWKDKPKLSARVDITYQNGETQSVATDLSWKCHAGPAVYNHMRQGERYDARLRLDGFDEAGFDDSEWENAVIAHEPGGILEEAKLPPIRVIRTLQPVGVRGGIYDFGENISGRARIRLHGERGREVRLVYDECLNAGGELCGNINEFTIRDGVPLCNEDVFICSGGEEEFAASFTYHGFRYVKAINAPEGFRITAEVMHTDLQRVGSFTCSDGMLNRIHEASVRATLSNYMGMPTDCPHREQNGWTGDAMLSSDQTLMNFEMGDAYTKWMRDFQDAQRPNGQLPGIVPCPGWGYNWGNGPSFDSALIVIPYNVYLHTGQTALIDMLWENMERYMAYFDRMCVDGIADFGLGDWKPVRQPACPARVIETAYHYGDCRMMAEMAEATGRASRIWREKASEARAVWRKAFRDREELRGFQTYYACALYFGLLDAEEVPDAAERLARLVADNGYHIDCGIRGTKFIFKALSENGYADVLYRMVTNPTYPSYAYWIAQGQTTLCETWDMSESCNHHMFSEVDNWLYRYVGGIRFTEDGLVIAPVLLPEVEHVKVSHRGICVERNKKRVKVSLPVSARIRIGSADFSAKPGTYEASFD